MDQNLTNDQVLQILAQHLKWETEYMRAVRTGNKERIRLLEAEYDAEAMVQAVIEAGNKEAHED